MPPRRVQGSGRQARIALAALAGAIALAVVIALATAQRAPSPGPGPAGTAAGGASLLPAPARVCRREVVPSPSYLAGDPCPSAVFAVGAAVATIRLPIQRMVILAGPMFCDVIWEGYGSPAACFGQDVRPGQYMHAYVSFVDSSKVAVVMLGLDLPLDDNDPLATRPPWNTTLVAFDIPPAGWVMP